jgi:hypothetical protein
MLGSLVSSSLIIYLFFLIILATAETTKTTPTTTKNINWFSAPMKINRHEWLPNMGPERLDYIQDAHANYPARTQALKNRLVNYTNKVWRDLSDTLTLNGSKPLLPAVPRGLDLLYGWKIPLAFNNAQGLFNAPYPAPAGAIHLLLCDGPRLLVQIDLDRSKVLNFYPGGSYHQRLLETLASIIVGKDQDELAQIASEFFLLCEIDRLLGDYIRGSSSVALEKARQQKQELDAKAKAKTHPGWDEVILPTELKEDLQTY